MPFPLRPVSLAFLEDAPTVLRFTAATGSRACGRVVTAMRRLETRLDPR